MRSTAALMLLASAAAGACEPQLEAALWAEEEQKLVGADVTVSTCPSPFTELRSGLSYYKDDEFLYEGATASARLRAPHFFSPFVGVGALLGSAERWAEDENGDMEKEYETSAFVYPEVGLNVYGAYGGFTLSARRYYGSAFSGNVIYSFGLSLPFE